MYVLKGGRPPTALGEGSDLGKNKEKDNKKQTTMGYKKKAVAMFRMFEQFSFPFLVSVCNDSVLDYSDERISPLSIRRPAIQNKWRRL